MGQPLRIVQISDIHLFGDQNNALLGVKTQDSFNAVVDLIKLEQKQLDLIILSGDMSQDGSHESYAYVAHALKIFDVPVYCVPGNHDRASMLNKVYPLDNVILDRHIVLKDWHIILLNSQKPAAVEGHLERREFEFLKTCLEEYPNHHALLVFHHHPVPVGSHWLDQIGLTNADQLWETLANYPKVRHIMFGHVHQQHEGEKNGVHYFATPSTCIQFKRQSYDFALEKLAPGYRWVDLYADGSLKTEVCRTLEYVGYYDENAKGY